MPNSQKGFIGQALMVLLLVAGIGLGTYLIGQKTNLLPQASENTDYAVQPYIVFPSDHTPSEQQANSYKISVNNAVKEVQNFYITKAGVTFKYLEPIIVSTQEDEATLRCGGDQNCLKDSRALNDTSGRAHQLCARATGADQPNIIKLIICAGVGGYASGSNNVTFGDATVGDWVLEPITGIKNSWAIYCSTDSTQFCTPNAAKGTIAHELGHSFGLKHPDDDPKKDTSVMMNHTAFPAVGFLPQETIQLKNSLFMNFTEIPGINCTLDDGKKIASGVIWYKCSNTRGACADNAGVGVPWVCKADGSWDKLKNLAGECVIDCKVNNGSNSSTLVQNNSNDANLANGGNSNCGQDENGANIPCYKIGVFDEATVINTKAGAAVAVTNYKTYNDILSKIMGLSQDAQFQAAIAKASAANTSGSGSAQACVNQ